MKNKKVLLLIDQSIFGIAPNSICIKKLVDAMNSRGMNIDILCLGKNKKITTEQGITEYCLKNQYLGYKNILMRIFRKILLNTISPEIGSFCKNSFIKVARRMLYKNEYQAVIASSGSFFTQEVLLNLKKRNNVKSISIFLDPPPSQNFLFSKSKFYYKKMLKIEQQVFKTVDWTFLEENLYKNYSNQAYLKSNVVSIGMPVVQNRVNLDFQKKPNTKKRIVFTGTLWSDIRNPKYAIEVLENYKDCSLEFWGNNQTYMVLKSLGKENLYYGSVSHDAVEGILSGADYLLNISNTNSIQTPSKIYEYISYGKPIINIVKNKSDITIDIIDRYGNGISILETEENQEKIDSFFKNEPKNLSFDYISNIFKEYTVFNFYQILIKKIIGDSELIT